MKILICKQCNKDFYTQSSRKDKKFCSKPCYSFYMIGKSHGHKTSNGCRWKQTEEVKERLSKNHNPKSNLNLVFRAKKGCVAWNKGAGGNRASWEAKRNALKRQSVDETTDFKMIEQFYLLAESLTEQTGIKYSVDHIKPISKGGKHHQDNLQVITLLDNMKKKDKFPFEVEHNYKPNLIKL